MKPVLIVEGKRLEVYALFYRDSKVHTAVAFDENGIEKKYRDISENMQYYVEELLQINFNKCLKWVGQHDDIFDSLNELIEQNQKETQLLADEIANDLEEQPCAVVNEKTKRRKELKQRTYGLMDAQDIVQAFMLDDVDLSGGEEDGAVQRMQQF